MPTVLGVRSFDPIWYNVDLQGNPFDDSFYLFTLQNVLPYNPQPVYHDVNLMNEWTDPIQFLANGTLPVDIYWDPNLIYRLEFRQGPDQSYPLIYEVNNYIPGGSGGNTPITDDSFSTGNQISNPQFARFNLQNPVTISGTNPAPIHIGPGWDLMVAGAGSVTLTQVALNNSNINPSNAPYALELNLSGWTAGSVMLRQRFFQNGMLWSSATVSSAITAQIIGAPQFISATLVDSQGHLLGTVLRSQEVGQAWVQLTDHVDLVVTEDTENPPAAYIDYLLALPSNVNIYVTSIQIIVQDNEQEPAFEQDSINRQIDHTYHDDFPIVPVGTVIDFGGFGTPRHYLLCNGSAFSRVNYYLLFAATTNVETVTLTSGSAVFTVVSGAKYRVGMGIEGPGIPPFTTIAAIATNTITMSTLASDSGPAILRFYAAAPVYQETVTITNGSSTFTAAGVANYGIGMAVTGFGIPALTSISSIVGTMVTINKAASFTGTSPATSILNFYGVGNGDTSTTFNVYNLIDNVIAGAGGVIFGASSSGLGAQGGFAAHQIGLNEIPQHTHSPLSPANGFFENQTGGGAVSGSGFLTNKQTTGGITGYLSQTQLSLVQQTTLLFKYIRYE